MGEMSINATPLILLTTNGDPVQVNVDAFAGPGGSEPDTTSTLVAGGSAAPAIATMAVHPTNPRAVIVTPGSSPGSLALFVSESPAADVNLQVNVQVDDPPNLRQLKYASHGPVTP